MSKLVSFRAFTLMLSGLVLFTININSAHSAWYERFMAQEDTSQNDTYEVKEADGDEIFVIDNYIYDARSFCQLSVGDKVAFSEGRHGIDYRATVYSLNSKQHCELLLRDPVS